MSVDEALGHLKAGTKAKRLQAMWPAVETKLGEGIRHAEILRLLNENGFELTERTYKCYLYRYRKKRRVTLTKPAPTHEAKAANTTTADGLQAAQARSSTAIERPKRPPTFEWDPGGISRELLE